MSETLAAAVLQEDGGDRGVEKGLFRMQQRGRQGLFILALLCAAAGAAPPLEPPRAGPPTQPASRPAPEPLVVPGAAPTSAPADEELGSPALLIFGLLFLVALVVCVAVLTVAALGVMGVTVLCVLLLLALGVVSLSVLVAFLRRSAGAGVRAFVIQAATLLGVPVGVVALVVAAGLVHWSPGVVVEILLGAILGAAAGGGIGVLAATALRWLSQAVANRLDRGRNCATRGHFVVEASALPSLPAPEATDDAALRRS
jgi:hypothetical protein